MALVVAGFIVQDAHAGRVLRRERRQQERIEQGEKSGELTQGEANRLEKGEARIEGEREKALSDGHMDRSERRKLERMENRQSRRIWRDKHNNRKAAGAEGGDKGGAPSTPDQPAGGSTPPSGQ
jgi:hypothetical protein